MPRQSIAEKKRVWMTWTKKILIVHLARAEAEAEYWHEQHIELARQTGRRQVMPWTAQKAVAALLTDREGDQP